MTTIPFEPRRFRSTVSFYARYRVPYPETLIGAVADRIGLAAGDRVLDLGCGPGLLAIAFARLGAAVTGMDPEPEMLAAASAAAAGQGLDIAFRQGSSYELGPDLGPLKLVTMGRSFHWMDRSATLDALDGLIAPGGAIALFHDRHIASLPDWHALIEPLSEQYAPSTHRTRRMRRDGGWLSHEAVLMQSNFSRLETLGRPFVQTLEAEDIVGRLYSMSVTSPEALGDRREAFEADLRARLADLAPDGCFTEYVSGEAILAFRG